MREVAEQDRRPVVCVLLRSVEPRNRIAVSIPDQATAILDRLIATAVERHEVIVLTAVEIRGQLGLLARVGRRNTLPLQRQPGRVAPRVIGPLVNLGTSLPAGGDQDDSQCKGTVASFVCRFIGLSRTPRPDPGRGSGSQRRSQHQPATAGRRCRQGGQTVIGAVADQARSSSSRGWSPLRGRVGRLRPKRGDLCARIG